MESKEKAAIMSRLIQAYNEALSNRDICLSVIAICMLHNITTLEELTAHGSTFRNRFCEQDDRARSSEQQA